MNGRVLMEAVVRAPLTGSVERCVESLCQQGCAKVNQYINELQAGQQPPGIEALDRTERQALLEELVSIMMVYQCRCDDE